jgi:hypothetical protein
MERRFAPVRTERLERAKAAIAKRLRAVCSHCTEAEFDELVERIALIDIKDTLRAERWIDR